MACPPIKRGSRKLAPAAIFPRLLMTAVQGRNLRRPVRGYSPLSRNARGAIGDPAGREEPDMPRFCTTQILRAETGRLRNFGTERRMNFGMKNHPGEVK
jgi:hypothetical protein